MVRPMPKRPSELINGSESSLPQQQQPRTTTSGWAGLLVVLLAGWLIFSVVSRMDWGGGKQDDHHEQKDDDKKQDDKKQDGNKKLAAKPGYLIIVTERIDTVDTSLAIDRISKFCADQKAAGVNLEHRNPDKDDDSEPVKKMIAHAAAKNIPPPFVLFKNEDKQLMGVIKLPPADATDAQILEVFR